MDDDTLPRLWTLGVTSAANKKGDPFIVYKIGERAGKDLYHGLDIGSCFFNSDGYVPERPTLQRTALKPHAKVPVRFIFYVDRC